MDHRRESPGRDLLSEVERLERRARRITDRYTWKRLAVFVALFIWLGRASVLEGEVTAPVYFGLWTAVMIGCWTASGWLLDLPKLLFPNVPAFQHLRRPAPRAARHHVG